MSAIERTILNVCMSGSNSEFAKEERKYSRFKEF